MSVRLCVYVHMLGATYPGEDAGRSGETGQAASFGKLRLHTTIGLASHAVLCVEPSSAHRRLAWQVRTGGKGTVRRKKKAVHKTATTDDKRLQVVHKLQLYDSFPSSLLLLRACISGTCHPRLKHVLLYVLSS